MLFLSFCRARRKHCAAALSILLLALALPAGNASAEGAARLSLQCTGWMPEYYAWEALPAPAVPSGALLRVDIDRAGRRLSTALARTGELVAHLEVSERFYSGTVALGQMVFNRSLDAVEISINRQTGAGQLRYVVGESSYPAFVGTCAPDGRRT